VKTFVDTNVLVYAHDTDAGDRHAVAKAHLAQLWDSREGVLSTQVLQEFYAVVTRKFKPSMARAKARAIVAAYGEWCAVATEPQLIVSASRLEEEHTPSAKPDLDGWLAAVEADDQFSDAVDIEGARRPRAGHCGRCRGLRNMPQRKRRK
jgi:predicted nucleic acid-binding protein